MTKIFPSPYSTPIVKKEYAVPTVAEKIQELGLSICYVIPPGNPGGGATILYKKAENFKSSKMVEVAVAYCSDSDIFSKELGRELALLNWLEGKRVTVPARTNNDDWTIVGNLRSMFWYVLQH